MCFIIGMKPSGRHARWLMWTARKKKPNTTYTEQNVLKQKIKRQEQAVFSHPKQTSSPPTHIFFEKSYLDILKNPVQDSWLYRGSSLGMMRSIILLQRFVFLLKVWQSDDVQLRQRCTVLLFTHLKYPISHTCTCCCFTAFVAAVTDFCE